MTTPDRRHRHRDADPDGTRLPRQLSGWKTQLAATTRHTIGTTLVDAGRRDERKESGGRNARF